MIWLPQESSTENNIKDHYVIILWGNQINLYPMDIKETNISQHYKIMLIKKVEKKKLKKKSIRVL